jgi:hypothetical protein
MNQSDKNFLDVTIKGYPLDNLVFVDSPPGDQPLNGFSIVEIRYLKL